jgi:hypothetical protein
MEIAAFQNNHFILPLMFADDQVIISDNEWTTQKALHDLNIVAKQCNLKISKKKIKSMALNVLDNEITEPVLTFKSRGRL